MRAPAAAPGQSQQELLDLIEKLPIGVFVGRGGKILYANPTLASYLGCAPADLVGKGPEDLLAPEDRADGRANVQDEGGPYRTIATREWRFLRADRRIVTLESAATREIQFEGSPAILWTLRDVTEVKAMQAQLMQSDRLASVGLLAAGIAHEINNPLAYLIAALEFVGERCGGLAEHLPAAELGRLTEALAEAREGADRVRNVVRDLKTFSRSDEERPSVLELQPVLDSAISIAWNEVRYRARLTRLYGATPPVLASESRLGQLFLNLLVNAAQAIREGDAAGNEIRVETRTDAAGRAVVELSDTGAGIPAEILGRIFEPFFTTKPRTVGTGLGLFICRNIVRDAGGEISVESGGDAGTTFRVVLPPSPRAAELAAPAEPRAPPCRRGRILVVDDEPAICAALVRMLGGEHELTALTDAREARARIAAGERFDVIFCDLMMPRMSGMELHAELLAVAPDQARRLVLLTGGAFTAGAAEFVSTFPNARIEKPFGADEVRARVRELLG